MKPGGFATWDTDRESGTGDIWACCYPGGTTMPAPGTYYRERLGGSSDHGTASSVACRKNTSSCLAVWIVDHNDVFYTMAREIILESNNNGELTQHETDFFQPLDNPAPVTSWWVGNPFTAISGGSKNYYLSFTAIGQHTMLCSRAETAYFQISPGPCFCRRPSPVINRRTLT